MVCDQPYVTPALLNNLIAKHRDTAKPIITSYYSNTFGPPTLFHRSMFDDLLQLKGDTGARRVVQQHANNIDIINFPQGKIDIDTQSDYDNVLNNTI
jgi:molybdenum cofactor cytidylyltransferase